MASDAGRGTGRGSGRQRARVGARHPEKSKARATGRAGPSPHVRVISTGKRPPSPWGSFCVSSWSRHRWPVVAITARNCRDGVSCAWCDRHRCDVGHELRRARGPRSTKVCGEIDVRHTFVAIPRGGDGGAERDAWIAERQNPAEDRNRVTWSVSCSLDGHSWTSRPPRCSEPIHNDGSDDARDGCPASTRSRRRPATRMTSCVSPRCSLSVWS